MADSSFDIVSKVERQEVDNALNQAAKEISQRYDFKSVGRVDRVVGREDRDAGQLRGAGEGRCSTSSSPSWSSAGSH